MSIEKVEQGEYSLMEPIMILSLKRSGSTLLRNILNAHPKIFGQALLIGPLCDAIYNTSYLAMAMQSENSAAINLESERKQHALLATRKAVQGIMDEYICSGEKITWCDKSLENLDYLGLIKTVFPGMRFVCLYRHCLDFVNSYLTMTRLRFPPEICPYVSKRPYNIVAALVEYWTEKTNMIIAFERENSHQCVRVNYEELVTNQKSMFHKLFQFIDMSDDDVLVENLFSEGGLGVAEGDIKFHMSRGIHTDSIGNGQDIPIEVIPKPVLDNMIKTLNAAGYKTFKDDLFNLAQWSGFRRSVGNEDLAGHGIQDIIDRLQHVIETKNCYARKIGGKGKLVVNGEGGGVWLIDLTNEAKKIRAGEGEADCIINLSSNVLRELVFKRMSLFDAYQNGSIGVAGNVSLATSFGKLLLE